MKSAGHIGWYEHEAWDEGDLLGLGEEQHLYNTYLPIPSFPLSKHSLPGNQPTQQQLVPCRTQACCTAPVCCRQALELGAGKKTSCHPPSPLLFQRFQKGRRKEGCFLRSFLLSGAGICAG